MKASVKVTKSYIGINFYVASMDLEAREALKVTLVILCDQISHLVQKTALMVRYIGEKGLELGSVEIHGPRTMISEDLGI